MNFVRQTIIGFLVPERVRFQSTLALNTPNFIRIGQNQENQIIDQSLRLPLTMPKFSATAVIMIGTTHDVPVNVPGNLLDPVYLLSVITASHPYFSTIIRPITTIVSSYLLY